MVIILVVSGQLGGVFNDGHVNVQSKDFIWLVFRPICFNCGFA